MGGGSSWRSGPRHRRSGRHRPPSARSDVPSTSQMAGVDRTSPLVWIGKPATSVPSWFTPFTFPDSSPKQISSCGSPSKSPTEGVDWVDWEEVQEVGHGEPGRTFPKRPIPRAGRPCPGGRCRGSRSRSRRRPPATGCGIGGHARRIPRPGQDHAAVAVQDVDAPAGPLARNDDLVVAVAIEVGDGGEELTSEGELIVPVKKGQPEHALPSMLKA